MIVIIQLNWTFIFQIRNTADFFQARIVFAGIISKPIFLLSSIILIFRLRSVSCLMNNKILHVNFSEQNVGVLKLIRILILRIFHFQKKESATYQTVTAWNLPGLDTFSPLLYHRKADTNIVSSSSPPLLPFLFFLLIQVSVVKYL